ncbi:MAG: DUF4340 domain-containing protein [Desulfobacteraceae bacterium]|nr:DUF4340 domain-containing protein [Desulfobacteraceae bacterium]
MKVKKEYIVLAVIIVALAVYLAVHKTDRVNYELPALEKYPDTEIARIKIEQPEKSVELMRKKGQWRITDQNWRADADKIHSMLDTLQNLEVTALVSEGGNYSTYNLGDQNRIHVTAWSADGKQIRSFYVGKTAPSYKHTFVRLPENPRVYHASGNFREQFANTAKQLRDKTVLAFDKSAVERIRIKKNKTVKELTRERPEKPAETESKKTPEEKSEADKPSQPVWKDTKGNKIAQDKVDQLLSRVNNLTCREFIGDPAEKNFKNPIYTMRLSTDSRQHSLRIYPKTGGNKAEAYPAESSDAPDPFTLDKSRADKIMNQLFGENGNGSEN